MRKLFVPIKPTQAGVVPYRIRDGGLDVLLITSRKSSRWLIPKGSIEAELGPRESARKEAFEEAGIVGLMGAEAVGCYRHGRSKKSPVVEVFIMRVENESPGWPEKAERRRRWVRIEEATRRVATQGLGAILEEVSRLLRLSAPRDAADDDGAHPALPPPGSGPG